MDTFNTLLEQSLTDLQTRANSSNPIPGLPTGFRDLDRALGGFSNSDLIVVGARPAMGKSTLLLNMALTQALVYNIPVLFYSLEKATNQIIRQILSCESGIEGNKISCGSLTSEEWQKLNEATSKLGNDVPLYIVDNPPYGITQFCKEAKEAVAHTGAKIIYIDNLHLFSSSLGAQNRYEEIAACTRELKHLAKELNIPIVMASQINRNPEHRSPNTTEHYKPYMYDLRDSGTICEDSNVVILLDRPEMKYRSYEDPNGNNIRGLVEVIIAKNHMGPEDSIRLRFKPEIAKMGNWEDDNYYIANHTMNSNLNMDDSFLSSPLSDNPI